MLKIENTVVFGWEAAIRGMRNPMNSWEKSDSGPAVDCGKCGKIEREGVCRKEDRDCTGYECFCVGENDLALMQRLVRSGPDHGKFLRMVNVTADITAPLYWWKEYDTYKVGTVANSCSTMHKIAAKPFSISDFSYEHLEGEYREGMLETIVLLNRARDIPSRISTLAGNADGKRASKPNVSATAPCAGNRKRRFERVSLAVLFRHGA